MAVHLLGAAGLRLEYPTRVVFESVTLGVGEGDRVGIVGCNGAGKPTLLGKDHTPAQLLERHWDRIPSSYRCRVPRARSGRRSGRQSAVLVWTNLKEIC